MKAARPITVGITGTGYPEKRNIIDLPHEGVRFVRHRDPVQWLDLLYFKATGRINDSLHAVHNHLGFGRADVLHFFNTVSLSRTPWVSTFETRIPRIYQPKRRLFEALARPACKRLIAMSQRALRIQDRLLDAHHDAKSEVLAKTIVLHPAQRVLIGSIVEKNPVGEHIKLAFVGHEFFRKGGLPTLRALDRLIGGGAPLHLTIVSDLLTGDHVSQSGASELNEASAIIARYPERITHHHQLPNAEVMALLRRTDVVLLPTLHDSYGYSVLEGQALGCPVISTDVAALPEINDDERGWMIHAPKDELGEGLWRTKEARMLFSTAIEEQLTAHLEAIVRDPASIKVKGARALERIRKDHDPGDRARVLDGIYAEAIRT
ncbi:MAG: glycosyltransferase family 4 protein [Flavobacteriales bacterium]|nr:glycosyltransferase family 4 protein [Flavobacteriales bacterium]